MNVSILIGSVREGRQSHKAAYYLEKVLEKRDVRVKLIDLAKEPLPVMGYRSRYDSGSEHRIRQISKQLDECDAIILVTPEYHGSFSGVLKNALDHFTPEFRKKPVGVVAASAGRMAGINASNQLQHVILSMGAFPVPLKLLIPEIHSSIDENFETKSEKIANTTEKFLDEFLWFSEALHQKKRKEEAA